MTKRKAAKTPPSDELSKLLECPEGEKLFFREKLILEFTELVADLLDKQGLSQADLARRLDVSRPVICRLMSGENATLSRVADVLLALGQECRLEAVPRQPDCGTCEGSNQGSSSEYQAPSETPAIQPDNDEPPQFALAA